MEMPTYHATAQLIREARRKLGYTQEACARRVLPSRDPATALKQWQRWEGGHSLPRDSEQLASIQRLLELDRLKLLAAWQAERLGSSEPIAKNSRDIDLASELHPEAGSKASVAEEAVKLFFAERDSIPQLVINDGTSANEFGIRFARKWLAQSKKELVIFTNNIWFANSYCDLYKDMSRSRKESQGSTVKVLFPPGGVLDPERGAIFGQEAANWLAANARDVGSQSVLATTGYHPDVGIFSQSEPAARTKMGVLRTTPNCIVLMSASKLHTSIDSEGWSTSDLLFQSMKSAWETAVNAGGVKVVTDLHPDVFSALKEGRSLLGNREYENAHHLMHDSRIRFRAFPSDWKESGPRPFIDSGPKSEVAGRKPVAADRTWGGDDEAEIDQEGTLKMEST
jgi:hypothetical protein